VKKGKNNQISFKRPCYNTEDQRFGGHRNRKEEVILVTHTKEIQAALNFIEKNLSEDISLDNIAKAVGFSKFYFHRTFQSEVGIPLYDYIRKRRLASASALLLNTDTSLLEIAIHFQFESQEAFARAFKSVYQLPPGRYRKVIKNLITGGSNMDNKSVIKGWFLTGLTPQKYQLYLDEKVFHTGTRSACIKSVSDEYKSGDFATVMQTFNARDFLKKRVRFSGFVKAREAAGWCGLWMRIDGASDVMLKFDNMQNRPIKGTTEWNHYSCVLDVPENAAVINIGMLINGKGQVWLDNVGFQEVDYNTPVTDFSPKSDHPDYPVNLSFE